MSLYKNQSFRARLGFALQGLVHGVRAERSLQVQVLALAAALAALGILRPGARCRAPPAPPPERAPGPAGCAPRARRARDPAARSPGVHGTTDSCTDS